MNTKLKATIIVILVAALIAGSVYAASIMITGTVTVQTPASLSIDDATLDFGTLSPSSTNTLTRTLTNNGGSSTNSLVMTNTVPAAVGALTWNVPSGTTIAAGNSLTVQFTLTVSGSAVDGQTNFNVNINDY